MLKIGEKYYFEWKGRTKIGIYKGEEDNLSLFEDHVTHDVYKLNSIRHITKL